ncbi:MAG: hypothetical protein CO186_02255 [Zetaproteobacteria bacterium CG_4_9_14_3_um_filter_49_83]|nr:MAG: hypothetical protein AUJ56_06300 [Zetaproteobacteria bacterium CG1_02_49_23]PIQ33432.1 MAG: hypothetical protein COW62_05020 [Zetaproteobacteria bacterium CG17_big_fil_post_rev_8_21_14_2_50_50_13]PIV29101.1 MAG: hypothetical protein COS35_13745 [Zetaproteobacteria bacterium CG02_land_8_20_14_3_00_50_9]PIY55639.1 MAG: hypothetical protein COZ00_08085 [Zetaproteobacteria bacterium CG_4_10_14_0_8_um_filter_49_80]PJA35988.1 MAG: hypothetical protein CO186_02255 [Zetaproteobacteria bacterium
MLLNTIKRTVFLLGLLILLPVMAQATIENSNQQSDPSRELSSEAVMQQFSGEQEESPERKIELQRKHEILFMMGVALLVLLFLTATMGIAMVAFEKDVFVAHIILAGLTLTLATVHAATSIAWFWPY